MQALFLNLKRVGDEKRKLGDKVDNKELSVKMLKKDCETLREKALVISETESMRN